MEEFKRAAAYAAVDRYVEDGLVVGLGSGTTSFWAIKEVGARLADGRLHDVRGVPTSERTVALAREAGIDLVSLAEARPDLTIDGADEISPSLDVIKGRGGALLREKIVASASRGGLVIVADGSKPVDVLGEGPLPVEVVPYGWETTLSALASLGCEAELRLVEARPFVTDGGHYIVDCLFPSIAEPAALEAEVKRIPGALECGLFVGLVCAAVVAHGEDRGGTQVLER